MRACVAARADVIIAVASLAKVHPNASSTDDERLRCRVGDDVVGEIDSFSRGRGKMKSFHGTFWPRDARLSRVMVRARGAFSL